ncbi:Mediator of RNA polymerase II transcription subunit 4 [Golovinomyces cichoracearum]|uniref:Mediator of RNA polymerase II transcription subunit 4 n=1 Tax=Golovinomyces cichoracearum TaxID=62708 RepID=A0A420ITD0_9PEZI|nr:Mediator of RNA polymerase II transcription subunit 4 [Golovinomyces cichoracearum]
MDSLLASRFKRVEMALASLIDSIAKYNPNPIHAKDLVAADAELTQGLEQLNTHQLNYARIISLRTTSKALDDQIRVTLENLASVRKEIISKPFRNPIPNVKSVSYNELLDYARRISKFTSPPSYRDPVINNEADGTTMATASANGQENATDTMRNESMPEPVQEIPTSQSTIMTNNNNWSDYLNPRSDQTWTPWPSEETIRRGALASIQMLVNQGIDLETFDAEKFGELEAARKLSINEKERQEEAQRPHLESEQIPQIRKQVTDTAADSGSNLESKEPQTRTKVFQLETFDDDDDDEFED